MKRGYRQTMRHSGVGPSTHANERSTYMIDSEFHVLYLGGHPRFPVTTRPTEGQLHLSDDALRFDVQGEYYETLFDINWNEVVGWDVEGANTSTRRTTGGRAAAGALLAGIPGAIVGLAATKEEFTSVLAIDFGHNRVGFLVRDLAPTAVVAALRNIVAIAHLYQSTRTPNATLQPWEYQTTGLRELEALGKDGWEAVGVWVDSAGTPQVLLKRAIDT